MEIRIVLVYSSKAVTLFTAQREYSGIPHKIPFRRLVRIPVMVGQSRCAAVGSLWRWGLGSPLLALMLWVEMAEASTVSVNSTADTVVSGDNECTLREAILSLNANNNLYGCGRSDLSPINAISIGTPGTITLTNSLPRITRDVVIRGSFGASFLRVNGATTKIRRSAPPIPRRG